MTASMNSNQVFYYNDSQPTVHSACFPTNFRMLIVGQSGCGKTTLLMRLLLEPNLLNYNKLCFFQDRYISPNINA